MQSRTATRSIALWAAALGLASTIGQASAQTPQTAPTDAWAWRATIYVWFPSIHSSNQESDLSNGGSIATEINPSFPSNLNSAFMGAFEGRTGPWSFTADAIYLSIGDVKTRTKSIGGPGGNVTLPLQANTSTDVDGFVATLIGGYAIVPSPDNPIDLIAGVRYTRMDTTLDWQFSAGAGVVPATGSVDTTRDLWDGIVGVRGRASLGSNWFVPYYADIGTGSSRFTWQALLGIGYRFDWGDARLAYRHLAYHFKSDRPLADLSFSGPALGLSFRF